MTRDDGGQEPLFPIPDPRAHARATDPETSADAARRLSDKTTMMRNLLTAFATGPLTAEEAANACGYTAASGAWKRVSDLEAAGLIEDTGLRRAGRSGRLQMVRRITTRGKGVL